MHARNYLFSAYMRNILFNFDCFVDLFYPFVHTKYTFSLLNISFTELDECQKLKNNWCPQICVNQKGAYNRTFKCECAHNFVDVHGDGFFCEPSNGMHYRATENCDKNKQINVFNVLFVV
jgi:hypothetical protein